ncbi:hypothetical protein CHH83_17255 [Bacillus sp. 7586-K]|nr:hypothetical protein CHH83_17255 [Bacillus sp. 7586-K]
MFNVIGSVVQINPYNNDFCTLKVKTVEGEKFQLGGKVANQVELHNHYSFSYEKVKKGHRLFNQIINMIKVNPSEKDSIIKFLIDNIEGVGRKSAEKVYDILGDRTLNDLTDRPDIIDFIGLGKKTSNAIKTYFKDSSEKKELLIQLQDMHLSYNESFTLIKKMQDEKIEDIVGVIKSNPYIISHYINNIGFLKCEEIARTIGFPVEHPIRIEECLYHILREEEQSGNSCVNSKILIRQMAQVLELKEENVQLILNDIELSKDVSYEKYNEDIYLKRNLYIENNIAHHLYKIENEYMSEINIDNVFNEIQSEGIALNIEQKQAVKMVFNNKVSLLSGGPGTGKTTTLKAILHIAKRKGLKYILAAPTGKASSKMEAATGEQAKTIHKTLEADLSTGVLQFKRNKNNYINADIIIIDESSMIDMFLFYNLIQAVNPKSRILFVGDTDQLPSVLAGKVFMDLISSNAFAHTKLKKIYRQGKDSLIVKNAHLLNSGKLMTLHDVNCIKDFFFVEKSEEEIGDYIKELIGYRLTASFGYHPSNDIQVLLPRKKGDLGVEKLNRQLQSILNPKSKDKSEITFRGTVFRVGDKVMQILNNEKKDVFNGDEGYIKYIDSESKEIVVEFTFNKLVTYHKEEFEEIMLSYSITVHKSQGSEYPVVILPIAKENEAMIRKKLVYTAMTRAKEKLILVGNKEVLYRGVYELVEQERHTNLDSIIKEQFGLISNSLNFDWDEELGYIGTFVVDPLINDEILNDIPESDIVAERLNYKLNTLVYEDVQFINEKILHDISEVDIVAEWFNYSLT